MPLSLRISATSVGRSRTEVRDRNNDHGDERDDIGQDWSDAVWVDEQDGEDGEEAESGDSRW